MLLPILVFQCFTFLYFKSYDLQLQKKLNVGRRHRLGLIHKALECIKKLLKCVPFCLLNLFRLVRVRYAGFEFISVLAEKISVLAEIYKNLVETRWQRFLHGMKKICFS